MLPDYIVYDEMSRREEYEEVDRRPYLEIPRYVPYWPEPDQDPDRDEEEESERDVIIIQM